jgi:hypothetical protein
LSNINPAATAGEMSIDINNIETIMESVILPSIYEREKGLKDYPSTGASSPVVVNGVEMSTFTRLFDYVFIDRQYVGSDLEASVKELANQINNLDWRDNEPLKKELFNALCSAEEISSLFYYALASTQEMRYCLALFSVDPCIAYLFFQWGIETLPQGNSFFKTCKLDELMVSSQLPFSTAGADTSWSSGDVDPCAYVLMWKNANLNQTVSEQNGFAQFALYAIVQRDSWIHSITEEQSGQEEYRDAWRGRLFGSKTSQLSTLVRINEKYNLNNGRALAYDINRGALIENASAASPAESSPNGNANPTLASAPVSKFASLTRGLGYQRIFEKLGYKDIVGGGNIEIPETPLAVVIAEAPPIEVGGITPAGEGAVEGQGGGAAAGGGGGGGGATTQEQNAAAGEALAAGGGGVLPGSVSNPTLGDVAISLSENDSKGKKNNYGGPQILLNSGRIIANAEEHLMLFGANGATLSSPNRINIDSDDTITLFGQDGLFLGLPNKGAPIEKQAETVKAAFANKLPPGQLFEASATADNESGYEPLVLGDKLANFLDDLMETLISATSLNPAGTGAWREDTRYHLEILSARVPEMLSTYAFIDGISHEEVRPMPTAPKSLSTSGGVYDENSEVGRRITQLNQRVAAAEQAARDAAAAAAAAAALAADPLSSLPGYYNAEPYNGQTW